MKTGNGSYLATREEAEANRRWYVVDAKGQVLGRLAARLATILMGKHKPTYTPHVDTGDFVIVLNAGEIKITGNKRNTMVYQRYSGYTGGQKEIPVERMLERHPERVISEATRRMLPKNKLATGMLKKLKVYAGDSHPHQAQCPEPLSV